MLDRISRETRVYRNLIFHSGQEILAQVVLPNRWSVSVGFGISHYCEWRFISQRDTGFAVPPFAGWNAAKTCEILIMDDTGAHWLPTCGISHTDGAIGWVLAELLQPVVDRVARMPNGPCPCPRCAFWGSDGPEE